MRTSRQLARRLAVYEALLHGAKTDADRRRLIKAIAQVRGSQRIHRAAAQLKQTLDDYFARPRGAA